jgi:AraC-like DNA-binding protein
MELARILIEQRRFKISDIAGMVGYANTSHFIAAFNKKYGATPGKFVQGR